MSKIWKNFPTPHCHPQSLDSGSTPESFAKKEVELGTGTLTVTDHGSLSACRKVYELAKKNKLTPILGAEFYYRDDNCPILTKHGIEKTFTVPKGQDKDAWLTAHPDGSFFDYMKYMHVTMHFLDQDAYETAVRLISKADARAERHGSERKPLFGWEELEELGGKNVTATSSCLAGMVQRHLCDKDNPAIAKDYFLKMKSIFKPGNFYVEVFPHECSKNWVSGVFLTIGGDKQKFHAGKKFRTNVGEVTALELAQQFNKKDNKHEVILGIKDYTVWSECEKKLEAAEHLEDFIQNECRPLAPNGAIQTGCNHAVIYLADKYKIPCLVSDDSHFTDASEKIVQDVRLSQGGGSWRMYEAYYRKSSADAFKHFSEKMDIREEQFEGWVDNALAWAERFKGFTWKTEPSIPSKFYPQNTLKHTKVLIDKHGRMDWENEVYRDRLKHEIELINQNGTVDLLPYFFVLEEVNSLYNDSGNLSGVGRGSAAGSLLAYLLGITHVDPIRYDLSIDRFLTLDRVKSGKLPDIDQDLPDRDLLVGDKDSDGRTGWLQERFGDHFAPISVDTRLRLKNAVKDVARMKYGYVSPDIEEMAKKFLMPPMGVEDINFILGYKSEDGTYVDGSIEKDEYLKKYISRYPEDWVIVQKCLGLKRSAAKHPCAFIIANKPISHFIPLTEISGVQCTQYTAKSVEAVGGVKMDFLVVNSLNDINNCLKIIQSRHGVQKTTKIDGKKVFGHRIVPFNGSIYDIWDLPEDQAVYADIVQAKTETVFQLSKGAVAWLPHFNHKKANGNKVIDSIEDLAAFTALDRPGPLDMFVSNPDDPTGVKQHNMLVEYTRRARGEAHSLDILEVFNELVPETYGVMCVSEGTFIKTKRGSVLIQDVVAGDVVQTHTGAWQKCTALLNQGTKECIELRLSTGEAVSLTHDHRVFTSRGWVQAQHIRNDDLIKQEWVSDRHIPVGDDRDWIIGLCLADGDLCATTPVVACSSESFAEAVKSIADSAWGLDCVVYQAGAWYCRLRHKKNPGNLRNPLTSFLRDEGLLGLDCFSKKFPEKISLAMLTGFFEGDGCVQNRRLRVKNHKLAHGFFEGLQAARIPSAFYQDEPGVWSVAVHGYLPMRIKKDVAALEEGYAIRPDLNFIQKKDGEVFYNHRRSPRPFITRKSLKKLQTRYPQLAETDCNVWARLSSIRSVGVRQVYDLSVENDHSFIGGGTALHNCYQEQLHKVYQHLTGCTGPEAEEFRSNVSKKNKDAIDKAYPFFVKNAAKALGGEEIAAKVFEYFQVWAKYGFNKSHALCYAKIAYACSWLKHHYQLEWWTAVLQNAKKEEIQSEFWAYCGDRILMPDVNKSSSLFVIEGESIRAPLSLLHGVGENAHKQLCAGVPYTDIQDFCDKIQAHKVTNGKSVMKEVKNKKTGEVTEEESVKLGHSALNRSVCYSLIVANTMDSLFPETVEDGGLQREVVLLDKLEMFEKALAAASGKKRPEPVDSKYCEVGPLTRYQMCKDVLPAYSENIFPHIEALQLSTISSKVSKGQLRHTYFWGNDEIPIVSGKELTRLDAVEFLPQKITVALPVFVSDYELFVYQKTKEAAKYQLDLNGTRLELVKWAGRDGLTAKDRIDISGSIAMFVVSKYKEGKPLAIDDIIVIHESQTAKKEKKNARKIT